MAGKGFNANGLKAACRAFEKATVERLKAGVDDASHVLGGSIADKAPVDTGQTRDSVEVKPVRRSKNTIRQTVQVGEGRGSGHDLGAIEFGTLHVEAQPFFRPAIGESKGKMIRIVEKAAKP